RPRRSWRRSCTRSSMRTSAVRPAAARATTARSSSRCSVWPASRRSACGRAWRPGSTARSRSSWSRQQPKQPTRLSQPARRASRRCPMDEKSKRNLKRARRAIEAASMSAKTREGRGRVEDVQLHYAGVAEPGYDNHDIVTRLGDVLSKLGVELEWEDEWATCDECMKLVRTSPDSYSWQRSYVDNDDGRTCVECIKQDPEAHLEGLEGQHERCNTIADIDPAKHGYVLVEDGFEHGLHPGQDASPRKISEALQEQG